MLIALSLLTAYITAQVKTSTLTAIFSTHTEAESPINVSLFCMRLPWNGQNGIGIRQFKHLVTIAPQRYWPFRAVQNVIANKLL